VPSLRVVPPADLPSSAVDRQYVDDVTVGAGQDGLSAYEVAVAEGFVGDEAAWLESLKGDPGDPGGPGQSAYEVAVGNGFVGDEAAWLASLTGADGNDGDDGESAYDIAVSNGFVGDEAAWLASLVGADGADAPAGPGAGFVFQNIDDTGTYIYVGYEHSDGRWWITRRTVADPAGPLPEAAGSSDYATAWSGRAVLTYE
jgi:hypothetical protein